MGGLFSGPIAPSDEEVNKALTQGMKFKSQKDIQEIWDRVVKNKNGELQKDEA